MRHTIIKLREELEKSIITKEKDLQSAINNDQITIRQLEKTIQELRVKNEKDRIGEDDRIQKAIAETSIENRYLEKNVQSLRDELEKEQMAQETRIQKAVADANIDIRYLKGMSNRFVMNLKNNKLVRNSNSKSCCGCLEITHLEKMSIPTR